VKAKLTITIETEAGTEMHLELNADIDESELAEVVAAGREVFELEDE